MIPDSSQLGTNDAETWRAVPAEINSSGEECGAWAVVAGDGDEPDVYLEVTAEYPQRVAEFIAAAVRAEATGRRFTGVAADVVAELERQRRTGESVTSAASSYLPDPARLALLVDGVGQLARDISIGGGRSHGEVGKRLYEDLTQVTAIAVGWMQALLARDLGNAGPEDSRGFAAGEVDAGGR